MKFQFIAENPQEEQILKTYPAIRPLFEPFLPPLQARSIMAGVRLGVFAALGPEPRTVNQLAQTLELDGDCLGLLLRVLVAAGYVTSEGDRYDLSELARATLLPDSPLRLTGWVEHNYFQWRCLEKLEEVLQNGQGVDFHQTVGGPRNWAIYQQAMLETARPAAAALAELVPVKQGARKMLDLGGSHGLYSAMICRQHPPLRAEILDLPEAVEHARELARAEGIGDVVEFRAGDLLEENLGRDYDVVFLGNIVHHFTPEQNRELFVRIRAALNPGGTVALWEFRRPDPGEPPNLVGDGFALLFRITSEAECYTVGDYTSWIETAGFEELIVHPGPSPSHQLLTARVP